MSTERFPRGKTAIVSGATHGIGESPGQTSLDLAVSASLRALNAVGLKPSDVDGLFIGLPDDYLSGLSFAEYLGICPRLTDNNRTGGSSFQTHAIHAALALEAGLCDVELIAYGSNQRTASGKLVSSMRPSPYEAPYK
ncbi:MAG: thiolase, partial [Burkholderiaceae bacterium]